MIRTLSTASLALALVIGMGLSYAPQAQAHWIPDVSHPHANGRIYFPPMPHLSVPNAISTQVSKVWISGDGSGMLAVSSGPHRSVYFNANTDFSRRYGGDIQASDVAVGDRILIYGRANSNGRFTATSIRDLSIWTYGVSAHTAQVNAINSATNTMVLSKGTWRDGGDTLTVVYPNSTPVQMQDSRITSDSSIRVGDTIRLDGQARLNNGQIHVTNVHKIWVVKSP